MKKIWTDEIVEFLKEYCPDHTNTEILAELKAKYDMEATVHSLRRIRIMHNIGLKPDWYTRYTPEMKEFIIQNCKNMSNIQLAEEMNKRFNMKLTPSNVSNYKLVMRRKTGADTKTNVNPGAFKAGHIPYNKGTKGICKPNSGTFKKGNSYISRPIGTERTLKDGRVEIKVGMPRKWRLKSHIVYEEYYGEKVEKYDVMVFLDGNRTNCDPKNLMKVSRSEQGTLRQMGMTKKTPEATKSNVYLARYMNKISKIKKRGNENE